MRPTALFLGAIALTSGIAPAGATPAELFTQRCAVCHQAGGAGLAGQYPRLAGRASIIAQTEPGRRYLALVLVHGLSGTISVDRQQIIGLMPSMAAMSDADIAGLLTYISQLGPAPKGKKAQPFTAAEVAQARKDSIAGPSAVAAERAKLSSAGVIP